MLVRSGIGRIRLIDFDQVTLSSLNRHAVANLEDVGTPKVQCLKRALLAVAPWVNIEICNTLWKLEVAEELLKGDPSYVVDAIDNIDTKVDLLYYCKTNNIPVISSMGAGCKSDPSRVRSSIPLFCYILPIYLAIYSHPLDCHRRHLRLDRRPPFPEYPSTPPCQGCYHWYSDCLLHRETRARESESPTSSGHSACCRLSR